MHSNFPILLLISKLHSVYRVKTCLLRPANWPLPSPLPKQLFLRSVSNYRCGRPARRRVGDGCCTSCTGQRAAWRRRQCYCGGDCKSWSTRRGGRSGEPGRGRATDGRPSHLKLLWPPQADPKLGLSSLMPTSWCSLVQVSSCHCPSPPMPPEVQIHLALDLFDHTKSVLFLKFDSASAVAAICLLGGRVLNVLFDSLLLYFG